MRKYLCFAILAVTCTGSGSGDSAQADGTDSDSPNGAEGGGGTSAGATEGAGNSSPGSSADGTGGADDTGGGADSNSGDGGDGTDSDDGGTDSGGEIPPLDECNLDRPKRSAIDGLPDWSHAGYREGQPLPEGGNNVILATDFGVAADDGNDDSAALQDAIDSVSGGSFDDFSVVRLPPGRIDLSEEIHVDRNFVIIQGAGSDPADGGTQIVVRPSSDMAYPGTIEEGTEPNFEGLDNNGGSGRWIWPGRGAFRVQTREVHSDYASSYESSPPNRSDVFEGSVNVHWKAGLKVDQTVDIVAQRGDTVISVDSSSASKLGTIEVGGFLWVGAANSTKMFEYQNVDPQYWSNAHMRVQVFRVTDVNSENRTVTIDRPLEFDLPANNSSDGSAEIDGKSYPSRIAPLRMVEGVGFEDFYLTYDLEGLPLHEGGVIAASSEDSVFEYGNIAPEYALHGIVFKWAANSWVRNVEIEMAGSHPIVTEVAKNLRIERVSLRGSWNKGKGGNGYFRGSRVWDSVFGCNVSRELRHFTLQWSASGNVVYGNDFDSDINLHGGWERHNLIEKNTVNVPFQHASGQCTINCGSEPDGGGTWFPIWWGAGAKSGKWSGATGPQNVLFRNVLTKQMTAGGPMEDFSPYFNSDNSLDDTIFQLGWDRETENGSDWEPLSKNGSPISDWSGNELVDFSTGSNTGVNQRSFSEESAYFDD